MTSEIRTNSIKSRTGLSTVSYADTGIIVSGIVTATSFVGALPISNDSNNRVITATGSGGLNGEANLTYDGTTLNIIDSAGGSGSHRLTIGNSHDLRLYHDGNSNIGHYGAGDFYLTSNSGTDLYVRSADDIFLQPQDGEDGIKVFGNGPVELYYDNSRVFETDSASVKLRDNIKAKFGTGDDLQLYHNGSHSIIANTTGNLYIQDDGEVHIGKVTNAELGIKVIGDGAVELYHDNSKKFQTYSNGIQFFGNIKNETDGTNQGLFLGAANDLQMYHDGTRSAINNRVGELRISAADNVRLGYSSSGNDTSVTENYAVFKLNGAVELFYDNNKKLETTSSGVTVTGTVSDSKGDLRKIIFKQESSAYTLVAADAGKAIEIASGGITVPASVFGAGDAITIINDSGSSQTITKGSGLNMFNTADANNANRTLGGRGMATVYFVNSSTCYITGAGLS